MRYKPQLWKEYKEDERLVHRYSENWKLAKRCLREYQESHARIRRSILATPKTYSFSELLNVTYQVPTVDWGAGQELAMI